MSFDQTTLDERSKFEKYKNFCGRVGACTECNLNASPAYLQKFEKFFNENTYPTAGKMTKFGHGDPDSDLMLVGLAPSKNPKSNIIFGAKSREVYEEFLDRLGESRESVWQSNLGKCFVPKRDTGDPRKCVEFLKEEIEIIDPEYVVLFGNKVVKAVLNEKFSLKGTVIEGERTFLTCYHPMYAVYSPKNKPVFLSIAEKIKEEIGGETDGNSS